MTVTASRDLAPSRHRYLRAPRPIVFPTGVPLEAKLPETRRHYEQRTALFMVLQSAFGERAVIGSDQFVYWDPTDPRQCCAPDLMVRLGQRDEPFDCWKVWERGAPELAIEIVSASDADYALWREKLEHYRRLGVRELVAFDPSDASLHIWDQVDGDLIERHPEDHYFCRCETLELFWCVRYDDKLGPVLRLARDLEGHELLPTPAEAKQLAEQARQVAEQARQDAERRIRELEAELRRRGG